MSSLAEIEAAAGELPRDQKEELLLLLAAQLRADRGAMPQVRDISAEEIQQWIAEDEADAAKLAGNGRS